MGFRSLKDIPSESIMAFRMSSNEWRFSCKRNSLNSSLKPSGDLETCKWTKLQNAIVAIKNHVQLTLRRRHIFQLGAVWPWTCTVPVRWCSRSFLIVESRHASICPRPMDRWPSTFVWSYDLFCADARDRTSTYCTNRMLKKR